MGHSIDADVVDTDPAIAPDDRGPRAELIDRAVADLPIACPACPLAGDPRALRALLTRALPHAALYRVTTERHVMTFLRCAAMLSDPLDPDTSSHEDVVLTLRHPSRSERDRVDRAARIAERQVAARNNARRSARRTPVPAPSRSSRPAPQTNNGPTLVARPLWPQPAAEVTEQPAPVVVVRPPEPSVRAEPRWGHDHTASTRWTLRVLSAAAFLAAASVGVLAIATAMR